LDRNTLLAFALSTLVFIGYVTFQESRRAETEAAAAAEQQVLELAVDDDARARGTFEDQSASAGPSERVVAPRDSDLDEISPEPPRSDPSRTIPLSVITLSNENVVAKISNGPALIESWQLQDYQEYVEGGEIPIELIHEDHPALRTELGEASGSGMGFADSRFEVVSQDSREVVQRAQNAAGVLTRTIRLDEEGYGFDLEMSFESHRNAPVDARFELSWPVESSDREDFKELSLLAYSEEEGVTRTLVQGVGKPGMFGFGGGENGSEIVEGRSTWAGFDVQYFTGVMIDPEGRGGLNVRFDALEPETSAKTEITLQSVSVESGGSTQTSLRGFLGPKTPEALELAGSGLKHSVNRGFSWLEPLTRAFEIALDWIYGFIPNYGLAIIVLTILVRVGTAPLMAKQMQSAERMRALQPQIKELQERYKDDRQKHSEETMKLYREEKVNPIAGCLPLLLQFPVLIGLFYALRSSIGLRHAPFALWITDLSQPATLFVMPGIDFPIRLLPLIMGGSMFVQQKMTPTTGMDPTQAKMMLIMMPAMMLFISYTFPSGLVLYWTVSNLLGIGQQYWIRSKMQPSS
jgi:YidC/Oxa1 family membrane protein insertase